jgi:hypothetical protein
LLDLAAGIAIAPRALGAPRSPQGIELFTFGDSVLDCGRYNEHSVHPGQLLVRNHDGLFPEFKGWDLQSLGPARLNHRAVDGATVDDLNRQLRGVRPVGPGMALLSVGGNDLLRGLAADSGRGMVAFEDALTGFVTSLPVRPLFIATVYDPTFGDDSRNFPNVDARCTREPPPGERRHRQSRRPTWSPCRPPSALPAGRSVLVHPHHRTQSDRRFGSAPGFPRSRWLAEAEAALGPSSGAKPRSVVQPASH